MWLLILARILLPIRLSILWIFDGLIHEILKLPCLVLNLVLDLILNPILHIILEVLELGLEVEIGWVNDHAVAPRCARSRVGKPLWILAVDALVVASINGPTT